MKTLVFQIDEETKTRFDDYYRDKYQFRGKPSLMKLIFETGLDALDDNTHENNTTNEAPGEDLY